MIQQNLVYITLGCALLLTGVVQNTAVYAIGLNAVGDKDGPIVKSDVEPVVWFESDGMVNSVRFSPDGRFLAAAFSTPAEPIKLWDMETEAEIGNFLWRPIRHISFSPDGALLVLSDGGSIRLWDMKARKEKQEIKHSHRCDGAGQFCFSPDGKLLAVVSTEPGRSIEERRGIVLLDVSSGRETIEMDYHKIMWAEPSYPRAISFSPDGEVLLGIFSRMAIFWDADTGQKLSKFRSMLMLNMETSRFSPDGSILALASPYGEILFRNVATGEDLLKKEVRGIGDARRHRRLISFSSDLKLVALVCDFDETPNSERWERWKRRREQSEPSGQVGLHVVKVFETDTGEEVKALAGHTDEITAIDFRPDKKLLVSGSRDGKVLLWKLEPSVRWIWHSSIVKHQTILDTQDEWESYDIALSHEALAEIYAELGLESAAADEKRLAVKAQYSESYYQEYLKKTRQPTMEDYTQEIRAQQAIISEEPGLEDAVRARYLVGKLYQKTGDHEKAMEFYQELVEEHPGTGIALLARRAMGTSLFELAKDEFEAGDNQAAILSLKEALEDREDMCWAAEARRLLADIYLQEEDERAALQEYRKLMELHPSSRWLFLQRTSGGKLSPSDANAIVAELEQKLEKD